MSKTIIQNLAKRSDMKRRESRKKREGEFERERRKIMILHFFRNLLGIIN